MSSSSLNITVLIRCEKVAGFIGKGGSGLKAIREQTGTRLEMSDIVNSMGFHPVVLFGSADCILSAVCAVIHRVFQSELQEDWEVAICIPEHQIGAVIGRGGKNLKAGLPYGIKAEVQRETNLNSITGVRERTLWLSGAPASMEGAFTAIMQDWLHKFGGIKLSPTSHRMPTDDDDERVALHSCLIQLLTARGGRLHVGVLAEVYTKNPSWRKLVQASGGVRGLCEQVPGLCLFHEPGGGPGALYFELEKSEGHSDADRELAIKLMRFVQTSGGSFKLRGMKEFYEQSQISEESVTRGGRTLQQFCFEFADLLRITPDRSICVAADSPNEDHKEENNPATRKPSHIGLPTADIKWSHDWISTSFSQGQSLVSLLQDLLSGKTSVSDIPLLEVHYVDNIWYCLSGNRRLWVLKEFERLRGTHGKIFVKICDESSKSHQWISKRMNTTTKGETVQFVCKRGDDCKCASMPLALAHASMFGLPVASDVDQSLGRAISANGGSIDMSRLGILLPANMGKLGTYLAKRSSFFSVHGRKVSLAALDITSLHAAEAEKDASHTSLAATASMPTAASSTKDPESAPLPSDSFPNLQGEMAPVLHQSADLDALAPKSAGETNALDGISTEKLWIEIKKREDLPLNWISQFLNDVVQRRQL